MKPKVSSEIRAARSAWPADRISLCAGTFLICFALLAFEISTVRTIRFIVGPSFIYLAIALAMLGLTAAGSILSVVDLNRYRKQRRVVFFWSCLAIALLLVAAQFLVTGSKAELNALVETAGHQGGLRAMFPVLIMDGAHEATKIGFFLCLPYFLFGGLLSYVFATSDSAEQGPLYAADLIGAATGCLAIVVAMETTAYAFSVTTPAIIATLAAAAYVLPGRKQAAAGAACAALVLVALPSLPSYRNAVEPSADPHFLVRDYNYKWDVREAWHRWNSFSRVGAVEILRGDNPRHTILSLDDGAGMAWLNPYRENPESPLLHRPTLPALLRGPAKDLLVLFAGAGADLMSAKEFGFDTVTGVELNHTVFDGARALPEYRFDAFTADPKVNLRLAEGRSFLEQDASKYDVVLMSWSGATATYFIGALGGTTQYLFTYEGLSSILDHLKPDGYAVVLQANKVKMLAALRRYLDERGLGHAERTAIVLVPYKYEHTWTRHFDNNALLINPSGWSDADVDRIIRNGARYGYTVAYAPGRPIDPDFTVFERILGAADVPAVLKSLQAETNLRFDVVTDNRPFDLDMFATSRYLSSDFWLGLPMGTLRDAPTIYHLFRVISVLMIGILAFTLAVGPLLLTKRLTSKSRGATYLSYFLCLGAGFMFLEIGILQKGSLLVGDPGLTIALGLGCIILFAGIGSLISNWSFERGLTFRRVAVLVVAYIVAMIVAFDPVLYAVLTWPLLAKTLVLALLIAPGAILMGHLFPQGLALARQEDPTLIPWAWAVNGAMSAFIAGLAPLVAQAFGFQMLFYVAGALYGAVILLPLAQPAKALRFAAPGAAAR